MPVDFVMPPPPLYFVFENSKTKRNDLARPVMETIFLVFREAFNHPFMLQTVQSEGVSPSPRALAQV